MSDTPRTDEDEDTCRNCGLHFVLAELAGKTERELTAKLTAAQRDVEHLKLQHETDLAVIAEERKWRTELQRDAERMREALELAIRQNSHDMVMTGDEIRLCEAALNAEKP